MYGKSVSLYLISVSSGRQEGEGGEGEKMPFSFIKKTQTFKWEAMSMGERNLVKGMKSDSLEFPP